jgi:transposase
MALIEPMIPPAKRGGQQREVNVREVVNAIFYVAKSGSWKLEIVKRNELHRFVVLPKRWIVERTIAWSHNRRLARDFERYARSAAAFIRLAMIRIMLRRLTRPAHCS